MDLLDARKWQHPNKAQRPFPQITITLQGQVKKAKVKIFADWHILLAWFATWSAWLAAISTTASAYSTPKTTYMSAWWSVWGGNHEQEGCHCLGWIHRDPQLPFSYKAYCCDHFTERIPKVIMALSMPPFLQVGVSSKIRTGDWMLTEHTQGPRECSAQLASKAIDEGLSLFSCWQTQLGKQQGTLTRKQTHKGWIVTTTWPVHKQTSKRKVHAVIGQPQQKLRLRTSAGWEQWWLPTAAYQPIDKQRGRQK